MLRAALLLREGFALDARELCEDALSLETSPYRRGLCALLAARAHSQLGHRADARAWYERVQEFAGEVDDVLVARAAREATQDFSIARSSALFIDPLRCDVTGP